ncbi:MAG: MarR family transcriptional regulator [Aeromicrobium sp.]
MADPAERTDEIDAVDEIVTQWNTERPDVDVSPLHVLGRLHRSYAAYLASITVVLEHRGLNVPAFDVLATLRRSGDPFRMTAGELASASLVSTGGVTLRVDRLETAGLVVRRRTGADRRIVHIQLTPLGRELIDSVIDDHFTNEARMLHELSTDEQRTLAALLSRLEKSIHTSTVPTPPGDIR